MPWEPGEPYISLEFYREHMGAARARETRYMNLLDHQSGIIKDLATQLAELKKDGFQPKAEKPRPRKVKPPEKSDEAIVRERDQAAINRMTKDFVDQGHPEPQARAEATRIRNESTRTTVHPA